MRTIRTAALPVALLLALELNLAPAVAERGDPGVAASAVRLTQGSEEAGRLVEWAIVRFEAAGLTLPAVEVQVHSNKTPCDGHLGLTYNTPDQFTLHLCTPGDGRGVVDRLTLVHELAHAWVADNVDTARQGRFMKVHGMETWWDAVDGWERQGVEWAAETIAWAVFDEGVRMIGEVDDDPAALRRGYEMLTGNTVTDLPIHDHSLAVRAADLGGDRASRRMELASLLDLRPLTLGELAKRWEAAVARRDLPTGLPGWNEWPDGVVVNAALTGAVELVAVTDGSGTVKAVTLVGTKSGQCESYDTLLAWALLLEALQPEQTLDIDAGRFDPALVEHHGQLRGIVHLPVSQTDRMGP